MIQECYGCMARSHSLIVVKRSNCQVRVQFTNVLKGFEQHRIDPSEYKH
jgi:hypothetical protein